MRADLIARAVKFLRDTDGKPGTVQQKMLFLQEKGLTHMEIMEAINEASGGELVRAALGGDPDIIH